MLLNAVKKAMVGVVLGGNIYVFLQDYVNYSFVLKSTKVVHIMKHYLNRYKIYPVSW